MAEIPISVRLAGQAITIGAEACYQHPARVGARVAAIQLGSCRKSLITCVCQEILLQPTKKILISIDF